MEGNMGESKLPAGKTAVQLLNELKPIDDEIIHEALEIADNAFSFPPAPTDVEE